MTVGSFLVLVAVITLFSLIIGMAGFGVARWGGAEIPASITSGAAACGSAMLIGIGLLAALLAVIT
ncbi:hypothetical protein [Streptomyces sp. NPDC005096]|uniref:hypothetical protein n=1 Tax=Streptomyces sp. NPDC005096 TaxID=3154559 RepID=UPI0033A6C735